MGEQIFVELSLIVIITVVVAIIAKALKQPLIIAYIAAGLILSPYGLDLIKSPESIEAFSQLGITLLLFMVGINLNPKIIKSVGKISVITGFGQIIFTSFFGFLLGKLLNFTTVESLYIAIAMTFSSTIVIMKLLSDKKDLDTLYGKISMGFLIVQDIVAMLILLFVSSLGSTENLSTVIFSSLIKTIGSITIVILLGRYILPKILKKLAQELELLMLACIAWCFALATIFHSIGLSIEIGALLAGVSISMSPYRNEITSRIRPLRDFFILMFFVFLGTQLEFTDFNQFLLPISIFSLFILIGNPLIVILLMSAFKYTKKTSFLSGLTVAQISEFSIIMIVMGIKMGHLDPSILSFVTVTGLITIGGSTYFIIYGKKLYRKIEKYLSLFERKGLKVDEKNTNHSTNYTAILLGYNHIGTNLTKTLKNLRKKFLVVDYDPEIIDNLLAKKIHCLYSDVEDDNLFEDVDFRKVKIVISTIKNPDLNLNLIHKIREINSKCIIVVATERIEEAFKCYEKGATYVIMPNYISGHQVSHLIENFGFDLSKFLNQKNKHLKQLKINY